MAQFRPIRLCCPVGRFNNGLHSRNSKNIYSENTLSKHTLKYTWKHFNQGSIFLLPLQDWIESYFLATQVRFKGVLGPCSPNDLYPAALLFKIWGLEQRKMKKHNIHTVKNVRTKYLRWCARFSPSPVWVIKLIRWIML